MGDGAGEAGVGGFEVVGLLYAGSGAVAFGDGYPGAHGGPEGAGADVDLVGVAFGVVGVVAVESGERALGVWLGKWVQGTATLRPGYTPDNLLKWRAVAISRNNTRLTLFHTRR